MWVDGSNVAFTNWAPGEPNDQNGVENCVEFYTRDGQWNDMPCTYSRAYVCKKAVGEFLSKNIFCKTTITCPKSALFYLYMGTAIWTKT